MNRKIAALVLGAVLVLAGACGNKSEPEAAPPPEDSGTAPAPEDFQLVEVPVNKPAPDVKVDAAAVPQELQMFTTVPGLTPDQQTCINGAIKGTVDADPSVPKTPGKVAYLGGKAVTICDGATVFTDPLIEQLSGGDPETKVKLTPEQATCLRQAFAADKDATAKVISSTISLSTTTITDALQPFEAKCNVKLTEAFGGS
jgi:hypothetical protein